MWLIAFHQAPHIAMAFTWKESSMQQATGAKVSMRHLYLYTHLLLDEANRQGRKVRLQWARISTASIQPDPKNPTDLLITLPEMASVGTEEDAILLRALISHEVLCHGHHTDFSVVPDKGIGGTLENVLEDPRGELRALANYPGSKNVIREGIDVLVARGVFAGPPVSEQLHPAEILTSWLVTELRSELLQQQCLEGFSIEYRKLAIRTFGSSLTAAVKAEALKATAAPTTGDVQLHSRRILELLKMAKDNPPPPSQGGSGDPKQGQQGKSDDSQGGGSGQQPGDQPQQPDAGKPGKADKKDSGKPGQHGQSGPGAGFEPDTSDLAKAIDEVLTATQDDAGSYAKGLEDHLVAGNEAIQSAASGSHTHEMWEQAAPVRDSADNKAEQRAGAKAVAAALSLKMEELLESMNMVRRRASTEGNIRPNRLWRVVFGDLNVHTKRSRVEELNTCVQLLVDESASMDQPFGDMKRRDAASRVTVAAGEVLNNATVPFGLTGYNTALREYQPIEGDWAKTLKNFAPASNSSTNTHLAVVRMLRTFIERKEARKVLAVITDGDPGDAQVLQAALNEAKAYGVEVRFVLIGNSEEHHYRRLNAPYGVANTPGELAQAVFGSLEAALAA